MLPVSLDCPIFILLSLRYSLTFLYSNRMEKNTVGTIQNLIGKSLKEEQLITPDT